MLRKQVEMTSVENMLMSFTKINANRHSEMFTTNHVFGDSSTFILG